MAKKVLGVGHCSYDSGRIGFLVESLGGVWENVASLDSAISLIKNGGYALVLPNRVIAGDEEGGFNVIKAVKSDIDCADIPVMLVSAIADAQATAEGLGAVKGLGKDILETDAARELIGEYLK